MTGVLITITLISLAVSGALLIFVIRLTREERDRSDTRAAALAERLDATVRSTADRMEADPTTAVIHASGGAAANHIGTASPPTPDRTADSSGTDAADPALGSEVSRAAVFFTGPAEGMASARLLIVAAIGTVIVGLAITGVYMANRPADLAESPAQAAAPLELLSLRHERAGDTLTVSGLVGNPDQSRQLNDVTIEIRTFDRAGTFLATGGGAVSLRRLAPGHESPFVVRLPGASDVARYRVTFRTAAGVMPHVDRRNQVSEALARGDRP